MKIKMNKYIRVIFILEVIISIVSFYFDNYIISDTIYIVQIVLLMIFFLLLQINIYLYIEKKYGINVKYPLLRVNFTKIVFENEYDEKVDKKREILYKVVQYIAISVALMFVFILIRIIFG